MVAPIDTLWLNPVFDVLANQIEALTAQPPDLLLAWRHLVTRTDRPEGFDAVFQHVRNATATDRSMAHAAIHRLLERQACGAQIGPALEALKDSTLAWPMACALAWIAVSGGESVMPPWVRASFRQAALIVRQLRDTNCGTPSCAGAPR